MSALTRLLGLDGLSRLYDATKSPSDVPFAQRVLHALEVTVQASGLHHIPARGSVLIAANHPHGALDGLAILSLALRVRPDVRVLASDVLAAVPEMRETCFFVDPSGRRGAAARSRAGLRAAHLWLRRGGALIVFPSGEVAHRGASGGTPEESAWKATAGRLAPAAGASVVPASIEGRNSWFFYAAGALHSGLRTALLPRELLGKRGSAVSVAFHQPLARARVLETIVPAVPPGDLEREIRRLAASACLIASGSFQVFCAEAEAIPSVLREIGRLREETYRRVGEGTGRAVDLDEFDTRYLHLFAWDREQRRIVGAYRIGRTDRLLAERGVEGLYTRRLFRFDERLFEGRPPALELGRSFVRHEYQRHPAALMLLWKGIGQFVVRHPHYRLLFGPVSISPRYSDTSQALLKAFLQQNHRHDALAQLIESHRPPRGSDAPPRGTAVPASIAEADALIRSFERDGKGVPVLLRQYLKLNARLLGFNVDPAFGGALDALMMVDLAEVDPAVLRRYLGRDTRASAAA